MFSRKQITVIGSVVVLIGVLLSLPIKGLVKDGARNTGAVNNQSSHSGTKVSLETISQSAKQTLNANLAEQITQLENSLKNVKGADRLRIQKELAQKWDDVNQPGPGAFYYEEIAKTENKYNNWVKAGDKFTEAYQSTTDSTVQPNLVEHALNSYKKANELQPAGLEAKTGLGIAYVNGSLNPMEGIQLLLGVVKEDPSNVKANMNLGLFSIRSGQYDKAITRFKTVLTEKPNDSEAWFYLASSYASLGMKQDAIASYTKAKDLAADPGLTEFVDREIEKLRK
ncbi:MAG TPA: tetratricopeptide repeat protein [Sphingobacteriaceae bacterium]|nr:tetratricopeptide repeat protein [Sphingobacteriaceae bacterium]